MRRPLAVAGLLLLAAGAYVTGDVLDVVPGVLTWDDGSWHAARPLVGGPTPVALPAVPAAQAPLADVSEAAPVPADAALRRRLGPLVADPWLAPSVGVVVRDGLTGRTLYAHEAARPRLAASTGKMLAAASILHDLDPASTLDTKVVRGATPGDVVLVAGGDTVLAPGAGNPATVGGRAGLGDLAGQVAARLRADGVRAVRLSVDLSFAAGPAYAPAWERADVAAGATQGVHMLGLDSQRPRIGHPSPADPPLVVAKELAAQLGAAGVPTTLVPRVAWPRTAVAGEELGVVHSAPLGEVLALALDESDNAMTEGLCRIAATRKGVAPTFAAAAAHVVANLRALGVDTHGVSLRDCSGLSRGQGTPVTAIADVLTLGTTGRDPALQDLVARLPVAGLTGTMTDRFEGARARDVAGVPRAKTGTLTGTSGLAGTTVDADGRLLAYVVIADHVPASVGTLAARAALDRFVAGLTRCGCSQ